MRGLFDLLALIISLSLSLILRTSVVVCVREGERHGREKKGRGQSQCD